MSGAQSDEMLHMRALATELVKENLAACATDVLTWRRRGILPATAKLREVAELLESASYADDALQQAEYMVVTQCLAHAAGPDARELI